jgi:hypothetical protein
MKKEIKFNKLRYSSELENVMLGADNLNELVQTLGNALNLKPMTNKLAENIKESPSEVFQAHVENTIPENLRNASFVFKLEYLGLTSQYNMIIDFFENRMGSWVAYTYDVKDGKFFISESIKKNIRESHTIYIETASEIQKYEYFEALKTMLNKGFEMELLNIYSRPVILKYIKELNLEVPEDKTEYEIAVNPYAIKNE